MTSRNKSQRKHNKHDYDSQSNSFSDSEEYNEDLIEIPSDTTKNRNKVKGTITKIVRSNKPDDDKIFELMQIYDATSYTFKIGSDYRKTVRNFDKLKKKNMTLYRLCTSPCSLTYSCISFSVKSIFYLMVTVCVVFVFVTTAKQLLIG
jgi:hypothetical protein